MKYVCSELLNFTRTVMEKAGLSQVESRIFANSLISAEMRGVASHGLTRLATYARRVEAGLVSNHTEPEIIKDGGSVLLIDGKNTMGAYAGFRSMELCMERAKIHGSAFATVFNGNHFGCASFFTSLAAENDMIGFAVANGPPAIPPTGGTKPLLGTNPVSIGIPAGKYRPFILDMATSAVARGRVALAQKKGEAVPYGWGIDSKGNPTTNPSDILNGGSMLPLGGAKGYGIALVVEILSSCLSGALCGQAMGSFYDFSRTQNSGYAFGAIDIGKIIDIASFKESVDSLFDSIKACPTAEGVAAIKIPGEIEFEKEFTAKQEGINLPEAVVNELKTLAEHYQIDF